MLTIFNKLNQFSRQRLSWALLLLSALSFELIAFYFQHVMKLAPCVLCIYQRCAILGILFAALIGLISPGNMLLRYLALIIWLFSAFRGLELAQYHVTLQFSPVIGQTCPINVDFPAWLPLEQWIPAFFKASGSCDERIWQFFFLEMSQWMVIIFYFYLITAILFMIVQAFQSPLKRCKIQQ